MNKTLAIVALSLLVAAPAFAEDGRVSQSTLANLGLGGMEVVSDEAGSQVRGMSSSAWATSFISFTYRLFDPNTGSEISLGGPLAGRGTDENAGLNAPSSATAMSVAPGVAPTLAVITFNGITWSANISAFSFSGFSMATSP